MSLLLILIICNVLIAIVFKMFNQFKVDNFEAIVVNYFTCYLMSCCFLGELTLNGELIHQKWFPWAIFLGILFISVFNITAISVQKVGMILTGIFHKMSLIFPALFGIYWLSEAAPMTKVVGISIALAAIILVNFKKKNEIESIESKYLILPLIIWLTSGIVECTFYYINSMSYLKDANIEFTGILFLIAGVLGFPLVLFRRKPNFLKNFIAGICLGIPNFFSIYLLLELLDKGWAASTVFPILNVSILALTAVVGFFIFREKLNAFRIIGLLLAAVSIYLVSI